MIKKNTLRITSLALAAIALGTILFLSTSESLFAEEEEIKCDCKSMEIKPSSIKAEITGKTKDISVVVTIEWKKIIKCDKLKQRGVKCTANYAVTAEGSKWTDLNGSTSPAGGDVTLTSKNIECDGKCNGREKTTKATTEITATFSGGKYPLKGQIEINVIGTGCDSVKDWNMILFLDSNLRKNIDEDKSDFDGDGLSGLQEDQLGTNPHKTDSDGDGIDDGTEVANGTDPNDARDPK